MPSIKKNFLYNLILTLSSYIISFIVFPYVSRVLGVEFYGKVGFAENVVSYFSLFSTLGITVIGVREIAACGKDREKRSDVFSSLIGLLVLNTAIVLLIFFTAIAFIPRFRAEHTLLLFGSFSLVCTALAIEWFYQGTENFRYVTLRTLAIRIVYAFCVFLFVKDPQDFVLYYVLTVVSVVLNTSINLFYSRNFADFSFSRIKIRQFFKPFYSLGLYRLMVSMYTTFNVVFLGFVCSDETVGYYYVSTKIYTICIGVLTAFTSVMMPRMSNLLSNNQFSQFKENIGKSFELVFSFAFPIIVGCVILASPLISLLSGNGYEGAVVPMRIIMPVVMISGLAQIWVIQVLMPLKEDKIILYGAIVGAAVGVALNFLLTGKLGAVGSALVLLLSELAGNSVTLIYALRRKLFSFPLRNLLRHTVASIPYAVICLASLFLFDNSFIILGAAFISCAVYFVFLHINWIKPAFSR